jgi:hypothetical protein
VPYDPAAGSGNPKKSKKPAQRGGLLVAYFFLSEGRYAELGYQVPFYLGPAVKNPVYRPFLLARQL